MQARLRIGLGVLILLVTIGSAITIGVILPISSINQINVVTDSILLYGQIGLEDIIPNDGTGNFSDFMYTQGFTNESFVYETARFEFFNVSDREGYLDYSSTIAYYYVQGALVFDLIVNKTIREYNPENDYIVYAYKKQYIFKPEESNLNGDETVLNFNYMWPYYIKNFGNGTEFGFQAYIAAYLLQQELTELKVREGYSDAELAYAVLNRTFAEEEALVDQSTYLPHNWLSVRPAYVDVNFDMATSYQILYNATYNGHDYSVLTGEPGSAKYFLDLIRGLDYNEPDDLTVDVDLLLADVYGIDTVEEIEVAKSFAAYLTYLLGKPSLDWLYENKISYVCKRTSMEWILGIEEPLLGNRKFPLLKNETLSSASVDWDNDIYYAEQLGFNNKNDVGKIIGIANIPYYENSKSMNVLIENNLAYVLEGGTDIKVVNITDPLFLAVGQYGDYRINSSTQEIIGRDGYITGYTVIDGFVYSTEGERGLEVLDTQDPKDILEIQQWSNSDETDFRDVDLLGSNLIIANGQYGLLYARVDLDNFIGSSDDFNGISGDALVVDGYVDPFDPSRVLAYVGLGTDGIDIVDALNPAAMNLIHHYDSTNFSKLTNVIDLKRDGSFLYVLDQTEGLLIFQIINSNNTLVELGQFAFNPLETPFTSMHIESTNVYLAQGDYGLTVADVSNRNNPTEQFVFEGVEHKGSAYGVFVDGNDIYLADYSEGLVYFEYTQTPVADFTFINKDELHTYVESWYQPSKVQFDHWSLSWEIAGERQFFNETYDSFGLPPYSVKGIRQQWSELYMRPFVYSSITETALFYGKEVLAFSAQYQIPYLQVDRNPLYWMTDSNFVNSSFIHAGRWNKMYDMGFDPMELDITHSLPGRISDAIHMHNMFVEPITGSIIERADRVQYNTRAKAFVESFSLLNPAKYGEDAGDIQEIHHYNTWHTTNPGLTGNMGALYWHEHLYFATEKFYDFLSEEFLDKIDKADSSRTIGAFGSMFLVTIGFVVTSITLNRTKPKVNSKPKKK
ncbi:MAG: hypothetical protein KAS63_10115 [Candidatus Heimdallarchaeota archaeon]|nr:hypothetical protein [Candidatus Heimdallarchaeota archaeon]MCK4955707.1 hypothetical protein [Candidatus Heimdallarchaeota archaeon]